jgi:hypothetical protein
MLAPAATECGDWPRFASYPELAATALRLDGLDPSFGAAGVPVVPLSLACVGRAEPVGNRPRPLPAGVPPLLAVGAWSDFPATDRAVAQVRGSTSIFHAGSGHELYVSGSACVIEHVDRYFTTRELPPRDTTCP